MATVRPTELEKHGDVRVDPYFWLRERESPDVIAYLEAENAYTEAAMAHTKDLQAALFEEIKGRIKQDDASVPYRLDDHYYYTRFEEGREYPLYCRKPGSLEADEEVMLDANVLAEGHDFLSVNTEVSPAHDLLAYAADTIGRRIYTLRFRDLATGEDLTDILTEVTGNVAWASDNRTVFYTRQDPVTLRWHRVYRHVLGTDPADDELVYHRETPVDGTAPLLLYGYGSYGYSMDATFSASRLSLLDRGFVFAIAHIRGGQELGRTWYEEGKLLKKKNTFTDFIDAAEYLVAERYADPERLFAQGGSAGGLLMGAVANMRPDLWKGIIANVPWVDVVTTMLDDSIPLTTSEYDEWGNPNDRVYYDYMLSYSPYDNVQARDYPNMLVTTGLHDSQVQYWEPAKWVAKLRAMKTDTNRLLLKTNMGAGHGGASGRFERYREIALDYAFLPDLAEG